jgi:hypothetical protein
MFFHCMWVELTFFMTVVKWRILVKSTPKSILKSSVPTEVHSCGSGASH